MLHNVFFSVITACSCLKITLPEQGTHTIVPLPLMQPLIMKVNLSPKSTKYRRYDHRQWTQNPISFHMMTSSNGNVSALLAICARNSPVTGEFPSLRQWRWVLMFSLICAWINGWVNNHEAGNLRRHRAHCDVIVMIVSVHVTFLWCR